MLLSLWPVAGSLRAQATGDRSTVVIVIGDQATLPIPTMLEGAANSAANIEMADQLFLRLANLGPDLVTAGDKSFVPMLARSWTRRDSVTIAFDLDDRASWQDGVPVTARDVVFTFQRARDPSIAPRLAGVLRRIASVTAEGTHRVVFTFTEPYAEQLYDAVWPVAPVPAHLLAKLPPDQWQRSSFAAKPVGSGPYKWVRSVPGAFVELEANDRFFLGAPGIRRVVILSAKDPEARMNLVLSHEADAMDNILPSLANIQRMSAEKGIRLIPVPSPSLGFLLFNQRDPADTSRPHPILTDRDVRRAIIRSLDRNLLVKAVFGSYAAVPYGPTSGILWIGHGTPKPTGPDPAEARRLLASRGWTDTDGDGILEKDGRPLRLTLNYPGTSAARRQISLLAQQQLRRVGIAVDLQQFDFPVWYGRRNAGQFDIDFSGTFQDPSPSGLFQGWTCKGATNAAHYCNPRVDSLIELAIADRDRVAVSWQAALRQIEEDAPAAFMYTPSNVLAVDRRFENVTIRPESSWLQLWKWTTKGSSARHGSGN